MDLDGADVLQSLQVDVLRVEQLLDLLVLGQDHDLESETKTFEVVKATAGTGKGEAWCWNILNS